MQAALMVTTDPTPLGTSHVRAPRDWWSIIIAIFTFTVLSLAVSITSDGFLEADGCTHYQYSKFAFSETHYLINIWGRPVCTALYAIPAQIGGRFAVRCTSLLLAIALSLVSY